ncbi:hypothetical protein LCGC14_2919570 [marine sediment metagenome]|uniref:AAA domain-containing protein n=1 Tax=marine sediment metagenome TaxID=412755 RepID=A0A0F8YB52_9ZZZZ
MPHWKFEGTETVAGYPMDRFCIARRYHIIVTGSSAKLLSTELATALAGRTLTYTVWPLSLEEHLRFLKIPGSAGEAICVGLEIT